MNTNATGPDAATIKLADELLAHALTHYEDGGWDVLVECWSAKEVADVLSTEGATTLAAAIAAIAAFSDVIGVWADRQADARNSAF